MKIAVKALFILLFSTTAFAVEDNQVSYKKVIYEINFPEPFKLVRFSAEVNHNDSTLNMIRIKSDLTNIIIQKKYLSKFSNVDLNSIRIYEGISKDLFDRNGSIVKANNYSIEDFSICLNYGELKEGVRLNEHGWYRNVLRIVIKPLGKFQIIDYPVEKQNVPQSACIYK